MAVAIVSGIMSLFAVALAHEGKGAVAKLQAQLRTDEKDAERARRSRTSFLRLGEPLGVAAFELQSRLFNVLQKHFLDRYYKGGAERRSAYAVDHTAFLIAQFFAWVGVVRHELQLLDLDLDGTTKKFAECIERVEKAWSTDSGGATELMVFRGEQRAIGEQMIETLGGRNVSCGYTSFLERVGDAAHPFLRQLLRDVADAVAGDSLDKAGSPLRVRLISVQHALVALLDHLDPDAMRFSRDRRSRVPSE